MKTFLADFRYVHGRTLTFAAVLPLVAAIPLIAEFIQHVVEMRIGMYASVEAAQAAESHPDRLLFGFFKTVALGLPAYFLIRWLFSDGNRKFARSLERPAVVLFAMVIGLQALFSWLSLYVWIDGYMATGFFVFGLVFMPLVVRFVVAAPLGTLISPAQSIRTMLPHALYAIAFPIVAILPLMAVHYALGIGAIFVSGEASKWAMMMADSVVTAWLALVITAANFVIATRPGSIRANGGEENTAMGTTAR